MRNTQGRLALWLTITAILVGLSILLTGLILVRRAGPGPAAEAAATISGEVSAALAGVVAPSPSAPIPTGTPPAAWSSTVSPLPSPRATPTSLETIFTTQVPQNTSQRWGEPQELGTRFSTTVDGVITAIRVYGADTESGLHTVRIWHWESATVAAGPYEWEYSGPGWHEFRLPAPVSVKASSDYVVVVSTGTDAAHDFVATAGGFDAPVLNGHLVTYPGSGVSTKEIGALPAYPLYENRNPFRDIVFVPGAATSLVPSPTAVAEAPASTIYYVAKNGNNSWSGTLPAPNGQGTDGPWLTIRHAVDAIQPGDTVYVRQGIYTEWVWIEESESGTEDHPKTLTVYPGESVTLDGAVYPTDWQLYSGQIWQTDAGWISFGWEGQARHVWQDDSWLRHSSSLGAMTEGSWWYNTSTEMLYVWLQGNGAPQPGQIAVGSLQNAFHLNVASWIVLDGFQIVHYYRAISQSDSLADQGRSMEGLTVRNCLIEHVGEGIGLAGASFGTWGYTHRSRLINNVIRETQSDAIWVGAGTDHLVRGNTIHDVKQAWYRGFVSAAVIVGNSEGTVVEMNRIYDVHALGIDIEHYPPGQYGHDNIVRRNELYDVGQHAIAILGANNTQVENNLIYDVDTFAILVNTEGGPALNNQIFNNTIYDMLDRGVAIIAGPGGALPNNTVIRNNIFSNIVHQAIENDGQNTSADYNLYWQTMDGVAHWLGTIYWTVADFHSAGQEIHGVAGNPDLVAPPYNLWLNEGSPAIDAGTNEGAPNLDFWGYPRPWDGDGDGTATVDIGGYEWTVTGPLLPLYLPVILKEYMH